MTRQVENILEKIKELPEEDRADVMEKLISMKDRSGRDVMQCAMKNSNDKNYVMRELMKSEPFLKLKWDTLAKNVQDWLR